MSARIKMTTKRRSTMKKAPLKIGHLPTLIIYMILPIMLILWGISLIFVLPFDYIKYKKSLYYKNTHKKYSMFAASGSSFKMYNEILKNNLPIRFVENPNGESIEHGWFDYDNILITQNSFPFEYNLEHKQWVYSTREQGENRIIMTLDEYIEIEIEEKNKLLGQEIYNDAIVFCYEHLIDDVEMGKKESRFIIYDDDNIEEVLRAFCETKMR